MSLDVHVLTLFPGAISDYSAVSVLGRAVERDIARVTTHDWREATTDVHRTVDDTPYGGGAGMVLSAEPLLRYIAQHPELPRPLIALTPSGEPFTQATAERLSAGAGFTLLCGRYEGFDQRILDIEVDEEISLGDFVLAGGELAALCIIEAATRLRPGALGNDVSSDDESFADGLLEYPQFTKPAVYEGREVPEVLRSGDHARIARWRLAQSLHRTLARRPDLIARRGGLSAADEALLAEFPALDATPETR
jgi:tRNA (guanine37-N1)-methyltransferase